MQDEQRKMNIRVYRECFDICDEVRVARSGRRIRKSDYPAAIVACADSWNNRANASIEKSGKVDRNSYTVTPALETALMRLGQIGGYRNECKNCIGSCAESHAARAAMKSNPKVAVSDLVFSYAYRPRTKMVIRYCRNCTDAFNVSNP